MAREGRQSTTLANVAVPFMAISEASEINGRRTIEAVVTIFMAVCIKVTTLARQKGVGSPSLFLEKNL